MNIQIPDGLIKAQCVRCGAEIALGDTQSIADDLRLSSTAFEAEPEWRPTRPAASADADSTWDDFRFNSTAIQRELLKLAGQPLPDLRMIPREPLPEDAPAQSDAWSKVLATLQIPGEKRTLNHFATAVILLAAVVMFAVGIAMHLDPDQRKKFERERTPPTVGVLLASVGMAGFGVWFGFFRKPNTLATTLWIFEEGVILKQAGVFHAASWQDVKEFKMTRATGRPLFRLGLASKVHVVLSVGHCPEVMPLMEYIEIRMAASQLLPRLQSIWEGKRERFGVLILDHKGITGPRFFAPWREVRRVVADPQNVFVDTVIRSQWVPFKYADVAFPQLLLAIAGVMIEEHERMPAPSE